MKTLSELPTWADDTHVHAVVETPRGSGCKLEFDPKLSAFTLAKPLIVGLTYPYDWGFIPSTRAEDGDPLDVMVLHEAATYPGVVLKCRPIGILEVRQTRNGERERNDRVFAVPEGSGGVMDFHDVQQLPSGATEKLERFFEATDALDGKSIEFLGWRAPEDAIRTIKRLSR